MDNELVTICEDIFHNIISQLTIHLRFMDIALDNYTYVPTASTIECDGIYLYYEPIYVIKTFKNNPKILTHGYLHVVLHSIFRHHILTFDCKPKLWNLACDIAVENMILELNLDMLKIDKTDKMLKEINKIKDKVTILTAHKIYAYLQDELENDQIELLAAIFTFDDHSKWCNIRTTVSTSTSLFGDESKDDPSIDTRNTYDKASNVIEDNEDLKHEESDDNEGMDLEKLKDSISQWQDISEKIEIDLETFSKNYASQSMSLVQSLKRLNQEKYNYSTFLRKFMSVGEKMIVNEDEFDYIYYTFGLDYYKNMPLIEPIEFKETNSLKDFVIAIDTSGSVSGEIVQSFLQKTYNIFMQRENFFNKFNIHIIQCDAKVQHDEKITSLNHFQEYIKNMELYGFGGTDFRPVFDYVDELIRQKEFTNLMGLIYFTDGDGNYPVNKTEYQTAFVFLDNAHYQESKVPSWAIKYLLNEQEIAEEA